MDLQRAKNIANIILERLQPYCSRIEVAGSVRRKKPTVNDIDFVLIPSDPWNLEHEIMGLRMAGQSLTAPHADGAKLKRFTYNGVQIDLYFAEEKTWATLLLIRTGSKESNIRLTSLAKKKGWKLHASGTGLFNEKGERIAGDTEESIFEALGLEYLPPEKRS
ncbi:hypothetical protein ES703_112972 [subsurface metagenome]